MWLWTHSLLLDRFQRGNSLGVVRRLSLAVAVALLLLSQLAGVGHHVLVAHYMCAEHGSVHHGAPEVATQSNHSQSPVDAATQPTRDEHHHDDCHWFSRITEATLESTALRVRVVDETQAITIDLRAADAVAALAILSLAPKQSPTVAA